MSCDHELANEWARCSGKNASYITTLLSIPSGILESVVTHALVTHASNDLASDRQCAFRKGFSTEFLLTQLTELWRKKRWTREKPLQGLLLILKRILTVSSTNNCWLKPGLHDNFFGTVPVWIWPRCLKFSARHPPFLSCKWKNSWHECPKTYGDRDYLSTWSRHSSVLGHSWKSIPFVMWKKGSSGPVTQWRQVSFLWMVMAFPRGVSFQGNEI